MNVLIVLLLALALFWLGTKFYSRFISRQIGSDNNIPTPAVSINDGRDYVPTKSHILFAHHFATIAGVGPIIGPVMGFTYGVVPVLAWLIVGAVFFGAVHDYTSIFASVRERGKSMAEIAGKTLGKPGFILFIIFTLVMIILVTSAFLGAAATSLTSKWALEDLTLSADQTLLKTVTENGVVKGVIGGIASTSVIIITAFAPILGFLIYKRKLRSLYAYLIAFVLCIVSIYFGFRHPVALDPRVWMAVISVYTFIAAGIPVWIVLQPRDFTNVQILYGGIFVVSLSLIIGGLGGLSINAPGFDFAAGTANLGMIWPMMFIVIACGAISGFHALAGGGTTSKQVNSEKDVRRIGYNAMILEGILATLVLLTLASALGHQDYLKIVWPPGGGGNPILGFALGVGNLVHNAFPFITVALGSVFGILMIEGFIVTTLDSAVRLNRYLFEELWNILFSGKVPSIMRKYWFNSGLSVILMFLMGYSNAFASLWKIFGSANQLLASLTLMAITVWLYVRGKRVWFTMIPASFMIVTTLASLIYLLLTDYIPTSNWILIVTDVILLMLAVAVAVLVIKTGIRLYYSSKPGIKTAVSPAQK
ncbi:MAG TPA: carbon starvation protein A [candidate division Zixibacteria bacterium]|nr:carbon starvation protein A [candidate division Zixibacteria bacterium]